MRWQPHDEEPRNRPSKIFGKSRLVKAFNNSVKAIEARDYPEQPSRVLDSISGYGS